MGVKVNIRNPKSDVIFQLCLTFSNFDIRYSSFRYQDPLTIYHYPSPITLYLLPITDFSPANISSTGVA